MDDGHSHSRRQAVPNGRGGPAFNVPAVVLASIAVLVAIHATQMLLLDRDAALRVLLDFSFIPGCYDAASELCAVRTEGAAVWSPVTYAFLHADWTHLGANALWLLAFGTPVARRIGALRFLLFAFGGAVAGALLFLALNPLLLAPVIGASGVVSAVMGAAARFALSAPDRIASRDIAFAPRLGIVESLSNRTVVFFVAIFFATNLFVGWGAGTALGSAMPVAWEAHLGGFAFGFLGFAAFDRRRTR